jgi:ribosomal protein S24E
MDRKNVLKIVKDVSTHLGATTKLGKRISYGKNPSTEYADSWKSPIFPVSDEKGYELFGAYQYGRGLNIINGAQFDSLLKQDRTRILNEDDIDSFLTELHKLKKEKLTIEQRKAHFESLTEKVYKRLYQDEGKLEKAYNRLTGEKLQGDNKRLGFIEGVSKALMTQTNDQVVANVPVRLSEIRPETRGGAACDCRGDTSDVEIFLADEGNYLGVQSPTDLDDSHIVSHYKEEMKGKVDQWKRRQDKLSGETE